MRAGVVRRIAGSPGEYQNRARERRAGAEARRALAAPKLVARLRDVDRARRAVEQRLAHRAAPPARGPRGLLLVTDDDDVALDLARQPADLLDRLADREVPGGLEAALLQLRDAFVQHLLGALLLLLEELLGKEPLGEEHARGHPRHREQVHL